MVKSTAVGWLTFDPASDSGNGAMVKDLLTSDLATGMTPLADVRTLKPNGMALGPLDARGNPLATASLYVTDLTEAGIRAITNPAGDPRTQTVAVVATTGDGRGANGRPTGRRCLIFVDVRCTS